MTFGIRFKIYLFFFLLIIATTFNFTMMIFIGYEAEEKHEWVLHTHKIISMTEKLLGLLRDAETGQRGFIITMNPSYLEPYTGSIDQSKSSLASLKLLTQDNHPQQIRLEKIEILIKNKFLELDRTILLAQKGKQAEVIKLVNTNLGKKIMDDIRVQLEDFLSEEKTFLIEREYKYQKIQTGTRYLFILELVMFVVIIIFIGFLIQKKIILPLNKLMLAVDNFQKNKAVDYIEPTSTDEIGLLTQSFNDMHQKVVQRVELIKDERDHALLESFTDPLTGLSNRRHLEISTEQIIAVSHRYDRDLCIVMLDIDHFKKINDTFGHLIGDKVLQALANILTRESRGSDMVIRYGGEEFLIILPNTTLDQAQKKSEKIRISVEILKLSSLNGGNITVSLGVAKLQNKEQIDDLILRADEALYKAKNSGRNRVCIANAY